MKRRLFNAAAVVSLVTCGTLAGLWVQSLRLPGGLVRSGRPRLEFRSAGGNVVFRYWAWDGDPDGWELHAVDTAYWHRPGFAYIFAPSDHTRGAPRWEPS